LPCSASTARDIKRSSITLNKNSTRAFQLAIKQGSTPPLTSSKWDKVPIFVVFWTISTIKDEKSAAKVHYIKNCQRQSCCAINCLSSGINILTGVSSVPLISERKGTNPHWKHLRCTHFTSYRGSRDVIASLACFQLTGWSVA